MLMQVRAGLARGCGAIGLEVLNTPLSDVFSSSDVAAGVTTLGVVAFGAANAVTDYTSLTPDWTDVNTELLAVGAALTAVFVVKKGVRMVIGMFSR